MVEEEEEDEKEEELVEEVEGELGGLGQVSVEVSVSEVEDVLGVCGLVWVGACGMNEWE